MRRRIPASTLFERVVGVDAEARRQLAPSPRRRRRPRRSRLSDRVALADRLADHVAEGLIGGRRRSRWPAPGRARCRAAAAAPAARRASAGRATASVEASSSTVKRAATLASNGNWCSSRVQKAWMVCTFSPPGVSSAEANSRRARARWLGIGVSRRCSSMICSSSAASSSAVHLRQRAEHAVRHVGGGRLGEGDAEDFRRIDAAQQQPDDALRQHMGLAGAGIGGDPGRHVGIGGLDLTRLTSGRDDARGAHSPPPSSPPPVSDHSLTRARWS